MVIAQLVTRRQYRGAEVSASWLSEGLTEQGHTVFFIGLYGPPPDELKPAGVISLDLSEKKKSFFSFSLFFNVIRFFDDHKPAIVQANGSDTLKYAVVARFFSRHKPKLVYRNISVMSTWVGKSFLKKVMNKFLLRKVDFITSVGEESKMDLVNNFAIAPLKIEVVKRGIPFNPVVRNEARDKLCSELGISRANPILIHIGHFSAEKNHEFLIDAFSLVVSRVPCITLVLVGDGALSGPMIQKVKTMGLKGVFFLGTRKDTASLLAASDLLLLTSNIEGVPGVVLEAAAQQTPAMAINVGGVSEVIMNDKTGILVDGHITTLFADKLCDVMSGKAKLNHLGLQAYNFALQNYSQAESVRKIVELYNRLISK
jgi:L-malate glycosyltransferase